MGFPRLLALLGTLAIGVLALAPNVPHLSPGLRNWAEPGNVAAALVEGRGFSDPFAGGTGPTAWVSPLPVWIEAGVFALCGVKTAAAAGVLLFLSAAGLAGALALLLAAVAPGGRAATLGTFLAFLLYCLVLPGNPLRVLSEAWLDLLLSAALLWALVGVDRPAARAVLVGVALLAPLDNAGLAAATGLALLLLAWRGRRQPERRWLAAVALAGLGLATAGWAVRNRAALGRFIPLKSNGWFELHLANVDSADGRPRMETVLRRLPFFDVGEFARYRDLGEVRYVETFRAPALAALRADPAHFLGNVLRRLELSLVFCRREGGGAGTHYPFQPGDAARLAAAGELIPLGGRAGALWTRIDRPVGAERSLLRGLGLQEQDAVYRDWVRQRLAYDAEFRSPAAIALGVFSAGLPVLALLLTRLGGRGALPAPALWSAVLLAGLILPYVLVNNNERHQLPLFGLQAVLLGGAAPALAGRGARGKAAA